MIKTMISFDKSFHFLYQSFAETKDRPNGLIVFGSSPEFGLTNHRIARHCSLHVVADIIAGLGQGKSEVVFVHQNLISNVYYLLLKRFAYVTLRQDSLVVSGLNWTEQINLSCGCKINWRIIALDSAIAQSEIWSQLNAQRIAESKRKKTSLFGWSLVSRGGSRN